MIIINSSQQDTMKIFRPFSRINVPIGLGYLISVLEREKITVGFIDEQTAGNTFALVAEYIKEKEPPYIFGFSVLTAAIKRSIIVSERLKELYPDSVIIFGGIHPTAVPEEVLSYKHVDIVLRGEAEETLPQLYRCLKKRGSFSHIEGISFRQNGGIIHNNAAPVVKDLDSLPPFPYHLFDSGEYDLGAIVSSRGCPYQCIFCSNRIITKMAYRYRSAESIVDEINLLYQKYNCRHILFMDDNLVVNKKRLYILLDRVMTEGLNEKMDFTFQARGDNVDYKLLCDLYRAGFRNISFGLETASERLMKIIKKGETVGQCIESVRMAKRIGFHVSATFIYGLPTETHEDRMSCIKLSKELRLDMPRFNNATPYPGTMLYEIAKKEDRLNIVGLYENFNSVSAMIENPFKKIPFSYVPIGSTENEIRNDILFSHLQFYLNIKKIRMMFSKRGATKRWFNPGNKLRDKIRKVPALFCFAIFLTIKFGTLLFDILLKRNTSISISEFIIILTGRWRRLNS
jgi:anaerobic magnesium-protoporphyrin IX monomethyl ester cyclase